MGNRKFGMNVIIAVAISFIGFVANFISNVVVARILGVEGKGIFTLFLVSVSTIIVFAGFGIGQGQMYHASKSPEKLPFFMPNAFVLSLLLGGGIALLYFLAGMVFDLKFVSMLNWEILVLGIFVTPVFSMLVFQRQFFLSIQAYKLSKLNQTLTHSLPLVFYMFFYLWGKITVENLIIAYVVSQVICLFVFEKKISKIVKFKLGFHKAFAKESFNFGVRQYLSDSVLYLTSRMDFFIVAYFLGQNGLGLYSVAVVLAEIAIRLPSELGTILFPAFASGKLNLDAPSILRKTVFFAAAASVFLAFSGDFIITFLFGSDFKGAVAPFLCLLPGVVAWSSIYVTWNNISAGGRPGIGIPIYGTAAILDLVLNSILIPRIGLAGAGISATVSYWFSASIFLILFCKKEKSTFSNAFIIKISDIKSFLASLSGIRQSMLKKAV